MAGDSIARFDLLYVDHIKFTLALAGQWARDWYICHIFFSKNCANTETHSFADIYAIQIFDERNNHTLLALL